MTMRQLLAIFVFMTLPFGNAFAKPEITFEYIDKMFAEAVVMPKGELKEVRPSEMSGVFLSKENPKLAKASFIFPANQISFHREQMVFKNDTFEKNNQFEILEEKSGKITLNFDPTRFDLYVIRVTTRSYSVTRPVTLNEVSKKQYTWDVSVSIITQEGSEKKQLTSFYFLLPKESQA